MRFHTLERTGEFPLTGTDWAEVGGLENERFGMLAARTNISGGSAMLDTNLFRFETDLVAGMFEGPGKAATMDEDIDIGEEA